MIGCIRCHGPLDHNRKCYICDIEEINKENGMSEDKFNKNNDQSQKVATLVPTKSDKELADEIRSKLIEVYQPVLDVLTEAKRKGFDVSVGTGADGFSIVRLMNIQIMKQY